jgi:hypothetical protein
VVVVIFVPTQGFFNFLIFIRPRYAHRRHCCPQESRWWALCKAVWNPLSKPEQRGNPRKKHVAACHEGNGSPRIVNEVLSLPERDVSERIEDLDKVQDSCGPVSCNVSWEDGPLEPTQASNCSEDAFNPVDRAPLGDHRRPPSAPSRTGDHRRPPSVPPEPDINPSCLYEA